LESCFLGGGFQDRTASRAHVFQVNPRPLAGEAKGYLPPFGGDVPGQGGHRRRLARLPGRVDDEVLPFLD
jgi:hypothetical protein